MRCYLYTADGELGFRIPAKRRKLLDYEGEQVYVIQARPSGKQPYVVIPGFVAECDSSKTGLEIFDFEQVPEEAIEGITRLVKEYGFEGTINFWFVAKS